MEVVFESFRPVTAEVDEVKLSLAISNLVENAIKYNVPEGKVMLWVGNTPEGMKIIVQDTGIGIPKDQQERIFERFYRVDKGRSRKAGGTGLGLSIVKHAVIFHGGKITAVNRQEGGLEFQFSLSCGSK